MKTLIWTVGGICAAAGILILASRRSPANVEELAHRLEDAWADHHTTT